MALQTARSLWYRSGIRGAAAASTTIAASAISPGVLDGKHNNDRLLMGSASMHSVSGGLFQHGCNRQRQQQQRTFADQSQDLTKTKIMSPQEMATLQKELLQEASYLTRTLYRKCLKSIKLLARGNARDEDDFSERETQELNQFSEEGGGVDLERISMAPPVNRQNELSSRANYYKTFTREHFDGHWSLLGKYGFHAGDEGSMRHGLGINQGEVGGGDHDGGGNNGRESYYMWKEEQIEQFIYLIRSGEEKRQWILNDYEFDDPCNPPEKDCSDNNGVINAHPVGWSQELGDRLTDFEAQSGLLVKEMYRRKGWIHSSAYGAQPCSEDDGFFSDSDSD